MKTDKFQLKKRSAINYKGWVTVPVTRDITSDIIERTNIKGFTHAQISKMLPKYDRMVIYRHLQKMVKYGLLRRSKNEYFLCIQEIKIYLTRISLEIMTQESLILNELDRLRFNRERVEKWKDI